MTHKVELDPPDNDSGQTSEDHDALETRGQKDKAGTRDGNVTTRTNSYPHISCGQSLRVLEYLGTGTVEHTGASLIPSPTNATTVRFDPCIRLCRS